MVSIILGVCACVGTGRMFNMKKRWIAALVLLAMLLSCFATVSFADTTYRQEDVEREIQELMAKYCGTYWRGNYLGAIQCKGFADMVFNELYGTRGPGPYSGSKYELPEAESRSCQELGVLSPSKSNYSSLKALLSQALPGDYVQCVRYTGTQHSMIVVERTNEGITFFDCNLKGSLLCASYTYTWEEVATYLTRGISLYRHDGYVPTTEYRLYFDPNGGTCDVESKPVTVGSTYGVLPTPEREGYLFDYWYVEQFNDSRTPREIPVSANSIKSAYANGYLKAHWTKDEGPCARFGHEWGDPVEVFPTCENDGYVQEICSVCGNTRDIAITPASGHSYRLTASVPATNIDNGSETYHCARCGKTYTETILCVLEKFTDLDKNGWYYPYVKNMVRDGLMNGTGDTSFSPNQTLTRAMLVTILFRMQGEPEAAPAPFTDVAQGSWYAAAVNWASESGVVTGFPDNTFRPDAPVTREQAATILFRYAPIMGRSNAERADLSEFIDRREITPFAQEPLEWAYACGILSGLPDKTLLPLGYAERNQIAKMLVTFLENTRQDNAPEVG